MIRFLFLASIPILFACGETNREPYLTYRAEFDVAKIEGVERVIKETAEKWNLRVYEKDKEQMKYLTQDKEAFYLFLYFKDDAVLSLGNVGVGEALSLTIVDYGKMPLNDLEHLRDDVLNLLKIRLDIEFEKSEDSQTWRR